MKKLLLALGVFAFAAIANVSAQSCAKSAACCAKKSSTSTSASTAVSGEGMVKKVANTNETKSASCSKGTAASCKKDASACHGASGKMTEAAAPATKPEPRMVKVVAKPENAATENQ